MKSKRNFTVTGMLFLLFAAFTAAVAKIDVKPVGAQQSDIGLASVNQFVFERLGVNLLWYDITNWLGAAAMLFVGGFAVLGLIQLIKRRNLLKVDANLLLLGCFYVLIAIAYLFFEKVIINYRPVILQDGLEASYPSSHTMLIICIMATAMMQFHRLLHGHKMWMVVLDCFSVLMILVTVCGRLISGVHWFTDIVGGVILSSALVMLYYSAIIYIEETHRQ